MVHADRRAMPSRVVCLGVSFRPRYCELGLLFLYTQQQHQHHAPNIRRQPAGIISTEEKEEEENAIKKNAQAVPLASAFQRPENQKGIRPAIRRSAR